MTTLILAAVLQPGTIAYEPNLRRYTDGDRWVYSIQTGDIPLHTMAIDLVFVKELPDRNVFEARTTSPKGGSVPDKNFVMFVLFAQNKLSGDSRILDTKTINFLGVQRGFKNLQPEALSTEPKSMIHPGRWDEKPKQASSVSFVTDMRPNAPNPYQYVGKETIDTGFASIECAVFEAKMPRGDWMKYWFNPRIGNYVKAMTSTDGRVMISLLKETNILSK